MSPEMAVQSHWRNIFQILYFKRNLALVAVDEAHCIHEWLDYHVHTLVLAMNKLFCRGADFRTSFRSIGGLRALTDAPFMAL